MPWFRKLMERRKPEYVSPLGAIWPLWSTRWFGLAVVLRFKSDSTFDQRAECNRLLYVLDGEYLRHYEVPRFGEMEPAVKVPEGAYLYGNDYGLWACVTHKAKALFFERIGRRGGVELFSHPSAEVDSAKRVVFLMFTWGGAWMS